METANVGQFRREQRVRVCRSCELGNHRNFDAELAIHFPRLMGSEQTHRVGFSKASARLGLWFHGICNPDTELRQLRESAYDGGDAISSFYSVQVCNRREVLAEGLV